MVRESIIALAVAGAMGSGALAADMPAATQPTAQQLLEQIKQLQAKVEALEAHQAGGNAEVAATVDQIYRDAQHRSQSLDALPLVGNWESGRFVLRSEDGNYSLRPWLQFQFRGTVSHRDDPDGAGGSDTEDGFELRRMKFGFDGNVFSPSTTYGFSWATSRNDGDVALEEAWVRQKLTNDWAVRGGQFKDPFARESLVSSKKLMAADRTVLTDTFTGGDNYVQGVAAQYRHDALQVAAAFTDGANSFNDNFRDFPTNNWDFGVAGRVQYKLFGDWSDYNQFTSLNDKHDLLVVGGGVDFSQGGDTSQILQTVDAQYNQTTGLGLFGALYGRATQNAPKGTGPTSGTDDTYDWGFIARISWLIPNTKWEPFGRYDFIHFDSANISAGASQEVNEITTGVNYYLHNHDAKFTLDLTYLPNGSPVSDTGADVLSSNGDEILLRGQFQLLL